MVQAIRASEKDDMDKNKFLLIVRDFLCIFHCMGSNESSRLVNSLSDISRDLTYHDDPFFVACAITGEDLNIRNYTKQILQVYERYDINN